ncbi:hypothetical protein P7K49_008060 [Saguinus oedipus]|uniref:Uncharacterized protein n=1 Tax=Saguinus oedipus TaxID=9490 RepID=A0ABQ9VWM7_SAGOE|nr:hypothetical protein P7K49_008060 [Saguinus oedipus]
MYSNHATTAYQENVFGAVYWDCFECLQWCSGKTDLKAEPVMGWRKKRLRQEDGEKLLKKSTGGMNVESQEQKSYRFIMGTEEPRKLSPERGRDETWGEF